MDIEKGRERNKEKRERGKERERQKACEADRGGERHRESWREKERKRDNSLKLKKPPVPTALLHRKDKIRLDARQNKPNSPRLEST